MDYDWDLGYLCDGNDDDDDNDDFYYDEDGGTYDLDSGHFDVQNYVVGELIPVEDSSDDNLVPLVELDDHVDHQLLPIIDLDDDDIYDGDEFDINFNNEIEIEIEEDEDEDEAEYEYEDEDEDEDEAEYEDEDEYEDDLPLSPIGNITSSLMYQTMNNNSSYVDDDEDREPESVQDFASPISLRLNQGLPIVGGNGEQSGEKKVVGCDGEKASSSEGKTKLNECENDGVSCSICFDPWTSDGGHHSICCLPCGHVYGMSCIKSWLQQPNSATCPQCNVVCGLDGIRKVYGLVIEPTNKELQEKIQLLEAKCASLELSDADWRKKEEEWRQKEALLRLQLSLKQQ